MTAAQIRRSDAAFWRATARKVERNYKRGTDSGSIIGLCDYANGWGALVVFTPEQAHRRRAQLACVKPDPGTYDAFYWPHPDALTGSSPWARPDACADSDPNNRVLAALLLAAMAEAGDLDDLYDATTKGQ